MTAIKCGWCDNPATHYGVHWSGVPSCHACEDHTQIASVAAFTHRGLVLPLDTVVLSEDSP